MPEEYLIRHSEYMELSKAEAIFLLEHINFSDLEKDTIKSIRNNFEKVRDIIRIKEFLSNSNFLISSKIDSR